MSTDERLHDEWNELKMCAAQIGIPIFHEMKIQRVLACLGLRREIDSIVFSPVIRGGSALVHTNNDAFHSSACLACLSSVLAASLGTLRCSSRTAILT